MAQRNKLQQALECLLVDRFIGFGLFMGFFDNKKYGISPDLTLKEEEEANPPPASSSSSNKTH